VKDIGSRAGYADASKVAVPKELLEAAQKAWDDALDLGEKHGYRNAQATVLAPTGTIGLLMDCDTTGIEPDFSLVKFKKLAGGGYFKIVNQSVPPALRRLGYSDVQIKEIVSYVSGTNTFAGAPHASRPFLLKQGLTTAEIERAEKTLPGVFNVGQALAPWVIGAEAYDRLGISKQERDKPGFSLLTKLGLTKQEIDEVNDWVIGRMTVEGAPHLRAEHLPVFDCANRCGTIGQRYLPPMAHVQMMGAAQPFLSGAISKTVNLPNEATVDEISDIYLQGWKLGLKAVALYRDGSKSSQPLNTSDKEKDKKEPGSAKASAKVATLSEPPEAPVQLKSTPSMRAPHIEEGARPPASVRHRLPKKRKGFTQEASVAGHKVFLRTGEYDDGNLGEIFIDMH
jgi:ribonucleoside-diphosphate reductase alpha chain